MSILKILSLDRHPQYSSLLPLHKQLQSFCSLAKVCVSNVLPHLQLLLNKINSLKQQVNDVKLGVLHFFSASISEIS